MKADTLPRPADAAQLADLASSCPAPAAAGSLAALAALGRPVVNLYLQGNGNNLNFGGCQSIGHSQAYFNCCGNVGAGADTIRALTDTIAAQQRTIDHLITLLERLTAARG
jgi:N-methylhydantoinase B/oxoprolinase/acetone carboxylase alpha subunit